MAYNTKQPLIKPVPLAQPQPVQPQVAMGSWVDPNRQAQISRAGLSQEQQNVNQIGQQIAASPEHRYGLMEGYNKEQEKQNQTLASLQPELRQLSERNIRQEADQITKNYGQGGEGANSFGNQYAAAVRGNNSASINMARAGNVVIPAGDALEKFGSIGAPMSQKLKSALADSDYMHQYEYMPGAINASMAGYQGTSMGDGSGGAAPGQTVGGENQREGWGNTFMPGGEYDRGGGKDAQWKFKHDYNLDGKYVGNQEPTGYRGASPDYLNNIKTWSKQPNNIWVDQQGGLNRMNYDSSGFLDSVSPRKGDTYTQRDNPDGKYTNWNWLRDNQKSTPASSPESAPKLAEGLRAPSAPTPAAKQPESMTPPAMAQNEDGTWSSYGGNRDVKQMSRNDKLNEILENGGGSLLKNGQDVMKLHDTALDSVIKELRGQAGPQDRDVLQSQFFLPQQGEMDNSLNKSPLAGVIEPPGAYTDWVPPKENYKPGEVMYGAPKLGDVKARPTDLVSQGGDMKARSLLAMGPDPNNDVFSQSLLGGAHPTYEKPAKIYPPLPGMKPTGGDYKPSGMGFEDGQIQQILEGHKAPGNALAPYTPDAPPLPPPPQTQEHRAVVNGYKKLKTQNPVMAQFLQRAFMENA